MDKLILSKIVSNDGKIKKFSRWLWLQSQSSGEVLRQVAFNLRDKME